MKGRRNPKDINVLRASLVCLHITLVAQKIKDINIMDFYFHPVKAEVKVASMFNLATHKEGACRNGDMLHFDSRWK
jgi:hypothetical protein